MQLSMIQEKKFSIAISELFLNKEKKIIQAS